MILQACIFEIVTTQVEQVPVPEWAFVALGLPVEKRNFRYADMLYPDGKRKDHWRAGNSVPDVSRPETKLWFYFLAASYIDLGIEAIHFGQTELMNGNDRDLAHYSQVLAPDPLLRRRARPPAHGALRLARPQRRPGAGRATCCMDFHSFPLRIKEVPDKPQEAILEVGFSDGIYGRSKGGHDVQRLDVRAPPVPGGDRQLGRQPAPGAGRGRAASGSGATTRSPGSPTRDEAYRGDWLRYARDWVRKTDPDGHLQMPGSRTMRSPLDGKRWYYANSPSPAVPDGLGDEAAIRAIWAADAEK